jgi:hypothetical protein
MNDEFERIWKEVARGLIEVLFPDFPSGIVESRDNRRIVCVPVEIRTRSLWLRV